MQNGISPVEGDAAQVENRRGGEQNVERCPHQTEGLTVDPVLVDQLDGSERHHQHWHEQVGKSQRDNEVVGLDFPGDGKEKCRVSDSSC